MRRCEDKMGIDKTDRWMIWVSAIGVAIILILLSISYVSANSYANSSQGNIIVRGWLQVNESLNLTGNFIYGNCSANQVLMYNGTYWVCGIGSYVAGTGIEINGSIIGQNLTWLDARIVAKAPPTQADNIMLYLDNQTMTQNLTALDARIVAKAPPTAADNIWVYLNNLTMTFNTTKNALINILRTDEVNLNVNHSVYATNSSYANTANNSGYLNGHTEANLNVNYSANSGLLNGHSEANLNVNHSDLCTALDVPYDADGNITYLDVKTFRTNFTNLDARIVEKAPPTAAQGPQLFLSGTTMNLNTTWTGENYLGLHAKADTAGASDTSINLISSSQCSGNDVATGIYTNGTAVCINVNTLTANNSALLNGHTEANLNVNHSTTATNLDSTSQCSGNNVATGISTSGVGQCVNVNTLASNSTTYWDGETSQADLNVNHSVTSGTATTWDGETSQADLNVNNSNTINGHSEADLNVNHSITSDTATNSLALGNKVEGDLNVNNSNTVTNGVYITGSYADPSWITSLNASRVITPPSACSAGNAVTGYTGNMYNQTCNAFMRVTGETGVTGNYQFVDNLTSTAYKFNGNADASITANATGLYISAPRIYMNATTSSIEAW